MKKITLALAGIAIIATIVVKAAPTYAKGLLFKYSDQVTIYITSMPCGIEKYKDKFPYAARAVKIANGKKDYLGGCYTGQGDSVIVQWQDINGQPSDQTVLPADYFEAIPEGETI